jgi:hypothetical protein
VEVLVAADGGTALVAGALLQDSRAEPRAGAEALIAKRLPPGPAPEISLFGLGSPELARLLLARTGRLHVLEPAASVARAFLGLADLSPALSSGRLRLLSPWSLAEGAEPPLSPLLLVHPASRRRAPALCRAFADLVLGRAAPGPLPGEKARILVVPPFYGGTLSMARFLVKAAGELGNGRNADTPADGGGSREDAGADAALPRPGDAAAAGRGGGASDPDVGETLVEGPLATARFVAWPEGLAREAEGFRKALPGTSPARLFRGCATHLADIAKGFRPHLIVAVAQAPLDLEGIEALKDACPEACAAFWFAEDYRRFGYARGTAPAWDLFLHIQEGLMDGPLRDWGVRRAAYLPPCADAGLFRPRRPEPRYRARVSFMGAGYPNRIGILAGLARDLGLRGFPGEGLRIFGSGWEAAPEALRPRLFEGGRRVSAEETARIYSSGDVNLNIHSGTGEGFDPGSAFVNPRTFEIAAAGAFQICDPRPLMAGLFTEDELTLAPSPEALPELVLHWLARPRERSLQGEAARARVLAVHLYRHRLETIIRLAFG